MSRLGLLRSARNLTSVVLESPGSATTDRPDELYSVLKGSNTHAFCASNHTPVYPVL